MTTETIETTEAGVSEIADSPEVTTTTPDAAVTETTVPTEVTDYGYGNTVDAEPLDLPTEPELKTEAEPEATEDATGSDAAATTTTPEVAPTAEPIDNQLVDRALQMGMTYDDVRLFPNAEALRSTVNFLAQKSGQTPVTTPEPTPPPDFAFKETLDPDEVAPEIVSHVDKMNAHYADTFGKMQAAHAKELEQIKLAVGGMVMSSRQSNTQARLSRFDAWTQSSPERSEAFGKGARSTFAPDSPEVRLRDKVEREAHLIADVHTARGEQVPTEAVLLDMAHRMTQAATSAVAPTQTQTETLARQEIAGKIKDRNGQIVARPTLQKAGPLRPSTESAIQFANEAMQDYTYNEPVEDVGL